jgi:hypothetical protein
MPMMLIIGRKRTYYKEKRRNFSSYNQGDWTRRKVYKSKYMVMSQDQNAGRSYSIKIDNSSFAKVEEFKYLGSTLTYKNSIQEEIKNRLKSRNACYHWCKIFYLPVCYPKI